MDAVASVVELVAAAAAVAAAIAAVVVAAVAVAVVVAAEETKCQVLHRVPFACVDLVIGSLLDFLVRETFAR